MKTSEVKERLSGRIDTISKRNDVFTIRRGFFYRMGKTSADLVNMVKEAFPNADILDSGEQWKTFRGGSSVANSSHWWVKFKV